jgi:hypothetical protein
VGVLALPATAIRSVNAGLIVGNPVGSSNTRAKALTSAELKAIIEASGISYLPLSGGTLTGALSIGSNALTCGAITATSISHGAGSFDFTNSLSRTLRFTSGNLVPVSGNVSSLGSVSQVFANISTRILSSDNNIVQQRNGLNAQSFELFTTYTSSTSFESLCLKATASAMQIGSAIGSAGGTNRPVQLGHFDAAGTFTSRLSVGTDGSLVIGGMSINPANGTLTLSQTFSITMQTSNAFTLRHGNNDPLVVRPLSGSGTYSTAGYGAIASANSSQTVGAYFTAIAAGTMEVRTAAHAPASFSAGQIIHVPPTSTITLSTNGQFSFEMTSNTAGNLVYRGSDGTERRNPQVFYPSGSMQRTLVHAPTWSTYTPAGAATATLLLSDTGSNLHNVTRPVSGNITIAFSGDSANQLFLLVLQTSGSGTPGTVTWPSGITWLTDSGAAPTISTAINKTDSIMFQRTGSGTYLGWHTGKN